MWSKLKLIGKHRVHLEQQWLVVVVVVVVVFFFFFVVVVDFELIELNY